MLKYTSFDIFFYSVKSFSIMEKPCFILIFILQRNNKDRYLLITYIDLSVCLFLLNNRNFSFKSKTSLALCLDSDSEDELKRSAALSQRLCEMSGSEQQQEELEKVSGFLSKYLDYRNKCLS